MHSISVFIVQNVVEMTLKHFLLATTVKMELKGKTHIIIDLGFTAGKTLMFFIFKGSQMIT